jgi:hypothetical protein
MPSHILKTPFGKQLQTVLGVCLIMFQQNELNKQNYGRKKAGAETLQNNLYITKAGKGHILLITDNNFTAYC